MAGNPWGAPASSSGSSGNPWGGSTGSAAPVEDDGENQLVGVDREKPETDGGFWGFFTNLPDNVAGFGTNVARDVGDIAIGTGAVIGAGLNDLVGAGQYVGYAAAGRDDLADAVDFKADDLAGALTGTNVGAYGPQNEQNGSVIANLYKEYYGPLVAGDAGQFAENLYTNPLQPIQDALMVVTGGGYAAAKATSLAGKAGLVSKAGTAAKVGGVVDDVARAGTAVKAAGSLDDVGKLQKVANLVRGTTKTDFDPLTGKVLLQDPAWNPGRRLAYQDTLRRLTTVDSKYALARADKLAAAAAKSSGTKRMQYLARSERLRAAAEKLVDLPKGARIQREFLSNKNAKRTVDLLTGLSAGTRTKVLDDVLDSYDRNLKQFEELDTPEGHVAEAQGLGTRALTSDNVPSLPGRGVRDAEVFDPVGPQDVDGQVRWAGGAEPAARPTPGGKWEQSARDYTGKMPEGAPNKNTVEEVPLSFLESIPGNKLGKTNIDELADDIAANGLDETLIIEFDPSTGRVYLGEGNHRVQALKKLGYENAPVRVVKGKVPNDKGVPVDQKVFEDEFGWVPSDMAPSWAGVPVAERVAGAVEDVAKAENVPNDDRFWSDKHIDDFILPKAGRAAPQKDLGDGIYEADPAGTVFESDRLFVATDPNGDVVGVMAYYTKNGGSVSVAVSPKARRKGYASKLYKAAEAEGVPVKDVTGKTTSAQGKALSDAYLAKGSGSPSGGSPAPEPQLPAQGTPARGEFDAARAAAEQDMVDILPEMRKEFGADASVRHAPLKDERSVRVAAEGRSWRDVTDAGGRLRIIADDAFTSDASISRIIARVEKVMGAKAKGVRNRINRPDSFSDGTPSYERHLTLMFERGGRPFEVQVLTPEAAKIMDKTANLRRIMRAYEALHERGVLVGDDALQFLKGKELSRHLWAGVTDEIRAARGGPAAAKERAAWNRFRVDLWGATTDPMLMRGLTLNSVFDNMYAPLRRAHGAKYDAAADGLVGGPSSMQLDHALAEAGEMAPVYYPLINADDLPARGEGLMRGTKPSRNATGTADRNLMRNSGKLLESGDFSTDIREVYRIRAAQSARLQANLDVLFDLAGEYGRPWDSSKPLQPGETLFSPQLLKRIVGQHNELMDNLAADPTGRGLRALVEKMGEANAQEAAKLLESGGDVDAVVLPAVVAKRMKAHASWLPEGFEIFVGTPTRLWKSMVLAGRPAWMANNLISNVIFTKLHGGNVSGSFRQMASKKYRAAVREAIGDEVLDRIEGSGVYSKTEREARAYSDDSWAGQFANAVQSRVSQNRAAGWVARRADQIQGLNNAMEDAFRRNLYLTAAQKKVIRAQVEGAHDSFWKSKSRLESALEMGVRGEKEYGELVDIVNKYMNDYNTMGPLARTLVRPYIGPFWAFYKHSVKLLAAMPFDHPAKASLLRSIADAQEANERDAGIEHMPSWMRSSSVFTGVGDAGDYRFVATGGANPFQGPTQGLEGLVGLASPLLKVPVEQAMGRSMFTGREFTSNDVVGNFGSDLRFDETGNLVDKVKPPLVEHLLQQIPQYSMVKDLLAGGNATDTSTILGPEPLLDQEGNPVSERTAAAILGKFFGYSEFDYDVEAYQEYLLDQQEQALKQFESRRAAVDAASSGSTSQGWG
jgi:GNAT superfamily N-acetyltransferase